MRQHWCRSIDAVAEYTTRGTCKQLGRFKGNKNKKMTHAYNQFRTWYAHTIEFDTLSPLDLVRSQHWIWYDLAMGLSTLEMLIKVSNPRLKVNSHHRTWYAFSLDLEAFPTSGFINSYHWTWYAFTLHSDSLRFTLGTDTLSFRNLIRFDLCTW